MAKALASALAGEPDGFGKPQAETAMKTVSALCKAGQCDDATADEVRARLGNHSAILQWAVKHSFIVAADDALTIATRAEISALDKAEDAKLEKLTAKK